MEGNNMNIGIICPFGGNFGEKGYYNSQEIGLGKALARKGYNVKVVKLISKKNQKNIKMDVINDRLSVVYIPSNSIGKHNIINASILENYDFNKIILFSDNQIVIPRIIKWAKKNNIDLKTYSGILNSKNSNKLIRFIMDILAKRNIKWYKKSKNVVKNNSIYNDFKSKGIDDVELIPVGIDIDLLNKQFDEYSSTAMKMELGFDKDDILLSFIGRIEEEKNPIKLIDIFYEISKINKKYKLIIVGNGNLQKDMLKKIEKYKLNNKIKYIERIENNDIWKIYHSSDVFLNLSHTEIFGMCILESMYYKCPVIAYRAPGPEFIINNSYDGYIANSFDWREWKILIEQSLENSKKLKLEGREKIDSYFNWDSLCLKFIN